MKMEKLLSPFEIWDKEEKLHAFCVRLINREPRLPGHMMDAAGYVLQRLSPRLQGAVKLWKSYEEEEKWKEEYFNGLLSTHPVPFADPELLFGNLMLNLSSLERIHGIIKPVS